MDGDDNQRERGSDPRPADRPGRTHTIAFVILAVIVAVLMIFAYAGR